MLAKVTASAEHAWPLQACEHNSDARSYALALYLLLSLYATVLFHCAGGDSSTVQSTATTHLMKPPDLNPGQTSRNAPIGKDSSGLSRKGVCSPPCTVVLHCTARLPGFQACAFMQGQQKTLRGALGSRRDGVTILGKVTHGSFRQPATL